MFRSAVGTVNFVATDFNPPNDNDSYFLSAVGTVHFKIKHSLSIVCVVPTELNTEGYYLSAD